MGVPPDYLNMLEKRLKRVNLSISEKVREAFEKIPREYFVGNQVATAYIDSPLPIPEGQTISAPHMYAMMLSKEISNPKPGLEVLEIGTGSGYGAALLAYVVAPSQVISIERIPQLVKFSEMNISSLPIKLDNLKIISGDGTSKVVDNRFDLILVTAVGKTVPSALIQQLKPDGRMIMPLQDNFEQWLCEITMKHGDINVRRLFQVRFVKLIGKEGFTS